MSVAPAVSWLPGHGLRPEGWDPGATSPEGWTEAELVRDVAAAAWRECERRHVATEIVSAGSYAQRGQDADAGAGSRLVVQLHADAGGGGRDGAQVFYWSGNVAGHQHAQRLAQALQAVVPWPVVVRSADASWTGARACLAAVRPTSVLVEVGFVDGSLGRARLPGMAQGIGRALGQAV